MRQVIDESLTQPATKLNLPIPTGGWNARDQLSMMKPVDAIYMENMFPRKTDCIVRKGYKAFVTAPVEEVADEAAIKSFLPYFPAVGINKLFAASDTGIYDVTFEDELTSDDKKLVCTDGRWHSVNMTTAAGSFLWACNGKDKCILHDGGNWINLDANSTPSLTGITSSQVTFVSIFKHRLILTKKDSLSFFYLPLDSVGGAATEFKLGAIFSKGGYLVATANWTIDAGEGADDYFVAITSQGEVAVYKGTDPSSLQTFFLVGVFNFIKPIGRKCFTKVGGDLYVITMAGLFPLSKTLISSAINRSIAASDRIVDAWRTFTELYSNIYGWECCLFSEMGMLLVNVPFKYDTSTGITYTYQCVMNTVTGSWCKFVGQNATTWVEFEGMLYFAEGRYVRKAWHGYSDLTNAIGVSVKSAYSSLIKSNSKRIGLLRIICQASIRFQLSLGIDVDYIETALSSVTSFSAIETAKWDASAWDNAKWVGEVPINSWRFVGHNLGSTLSLRLKFTIKDISMKWTATEAIVEASDSLL